MQKADQRSPDRQAGHETFRAVDRVDDPDIFGIGADIAELLTDDAVLGECLADHPADDEFRRAISFGHGIEIAAAGFVMRFDGGAEERQDRRS